MTIAAETSKRPYATQGRALRAARNRRHMSQENFAPIVGTTRRHLIRLENGEHRPSGDLLARIAEQTGADPESFGYPADDEEESRAVRGLSLDDFLRLRTREILREERELLGETG